MKTAPLSPYFRTNLNLFLRCTYEFDDDSQLKFKTACSDPSVLDDVSDIFNGNGMNAEKVITGLTCDKTCEGKTINSWEPIGK